ncbi:MAG: restriction endonuclease subunit S [Phocaeicola sp.]
MSCNWRKVRLGDVCRTNLNTLSSSDKWSYVKYLDTGNITNNHIDSIQTLIIGNEKIPSRAKRRIEPFDVIFSTVRPNQRHFGIIKKPVDNMIVSTGFTTITADREKILPEYIYYFLSQNEIIEGLQAIAEQAVSTYPSLKPIDLENLDIDLPPLAEQERIAAILGSLDDKIELNNRINKNLEEQAQALFKRWFVDFEFPDQNGQPYKSSGGAMKESELGEIPEDWIVGAFGDIITPKKGRNITRASVQVGNIPVIAGGLSASCYHNASNTNAPIVTVSASGANAGYVWLHHLPIWASDCSYIDKNITDYVYFAYSFLLYNQNAIYHKQQGCAQPHIYPSHLIELDTIISPIDLIVAFEDICKCFFEKIGTNKEENRTLADLRDSLLHKLMSNQIKI